jgi:hypothetical protein
MKYVSILSLLVGLLLLPARAQDAGSPEALRAAQELASLLNSDSMEQMKALAFNQTWSGIETQLGAKIDSATLAEVRAEVERTMSSVIDESLKDIPTVYAKVFSLQEIRELLAFYKTPIGMKSLKQMPKLLAESTAQSGPRVQALQMEMINRIRTIIEKHGYKN